jgi:hypothetical protein
VETLVSLFPGLALATLLLMVVLWWLSYRVLTIEDNSTSVDTATTIGVLSLVAGFFSGLVSAVLFFAWWLTSR